MVTSTESLLHCGGHIMRGQHAAANARTCSNQTLLYLLRLILFWLDLVVQVCSAVVDDAHNDNHHCVLQMRPLKEKTKELQSNHEAQVTTILDKYKSLRKQVQEYHQLLEAAISPSTSSVDANLSAAVKAISLR